MKPNNPFLISGYYSPEFFCDREQETVTILDALHNGRNVTLIAPRRMGKTGLIRHAFYRLKEKQPDIVTFYMDIYSTQSLGDFVRLFASTVLGQLDSVPQKALSRISQFIRSCRPVFTFDELTGVPKVTIDVAPAEEENTLKEIFEYLGSSEKRCYIAIDEFQQIAEYPEKGVEALLRSYIQFLPNVNFIFAGSKQHLMQEMFTSSKRPFYQSTQPLTIGPIQQDEYACFNIYLEQIDEMFSDNELIKMFYHNLADYMTDRNEVSTEQAVVDVMDLMRLIMSEKQVIQLFRFAEPVDWLARMYYRKQIVQVIADSGIDLWLLGRGWENHPAAMLDNVHIINDRIPFKDTLPIMAKAKINLNIMPWFKDGTHDRIFNILLQGSLPLTDKSKWLEDNFTDNENIVFMI